MTPDPEVLGAFSADASGGASSKGVGGEGVDDGEVEGEGALVAPKNCDVTIIVLPR